MPHDETYNHARRKVNFKSHLSVFFFKKKKKWTKEFLHSSDNHKVPNTATHRVCIISSIKLYIYIIIVNIKTWIHVDKHVSVG